MDTENWTHEQLVAFFSPSNYWPHPTGGGFRHVFTADKCGQCKKTANIPHGPGWMCPCGAYQILPYSDVQTPHDLPDHGPTAEALRAATDEVIALAEPTP